ncbi:MAG: penicillin acylase family protein [Acetobacteraceae bacterium]|nr:penicillin acylase family protein [Acetobacteraceae bacterium]
MRLRLLKHERIGALGIFRRVFAVLGIIVLLVAAAGTGALWLTLPPKHETLSIPGLSAPVQISFDQDGIPRIRAANESDAATALGYVHARDRIFQMEITRRIGSGRLSEIAGAATLPLDRQMRFLGLRRRASEDYAALPGEVRELLAAYARGVNAWAAAHGRFSAPEFLVLGAPEPWTEVDSILWGKEMALWLGSNWHTELARQTLAAKLPTHMISELWPQQHDSGHPDVASTDLGDGTAVASLLAGLPGFPSSYTQPSQASNAWVVDGRHTASGAPLLAGDPHLAFGFPSIWYLVRIETPGGVMAGASSPGVPFLVLGHNGHIAWSFTTTGADTQDVFMETPVGADQYATPEGPKPFSVREERIRVRGKPDLVVKMRETRHGPVISDVLAPGGPVLAVAMAHLVPGDTAPAGLLALNRAKTVQEAGRAAPMISAPVQNLLVADQAQIGLFVTGRIPIRRSGDGGAPVPGADGAHDWIGWASGEQLPHYINPASGELINANERIAPADFPVFLGRDWFADWRARRIRQMLRTSSRHTPADFAAMQVDAVSLYAQELLPVLRRAPRSPEGVASRAALLLANWDGAMRRDLPQPLIFNAWITRFRDLVLAQNEVPPGAAACPWAEFVAWVLSPEGSHWCRGGDCGPLLSEALTESMTELAQIYGDDPSAWRWGAAHQAVFAHGMLKNLPVIGGLSTARIAADGDETTVDRGGMPWSGFDSIHGAEFRGVYDLADLERSLFVITPGQSGNPISRHARDFVTRWRDGNTITLGPEARITAATIRLAP